MTPSPAPHVTPPPSGAGAPPLPVRWRWAITGYALCMLAGLAVALLLSGAPGSGRIAEAVAVMQQPYLQMLDAYRGQDDAAPDIEYVVFESEDETKQALRAFLQGRQDMRYAGQGLFPGVSVVRIRTDHLKASLDTLHQQPSVNMVLKARVGMICH